MVFIEVEMEYKKKLESVKDIPILEVAGRLGVSVIANTCTRCLHPEMKKAGTKTIEFNIKDNCYRCACIKEKGNVIELVKNAKNIDTQAAVNWLYEEFLLNIVKISSD